MGYLERWDMWLLVIFIILIIMCVWASWSKRDKTSSTTSSQTSSSLTETRVEEMPTEPPPTTIQYSRAVVPYAYASPQGLIKKKEPKQSIGERGCLDVMKRIYPREEILIQVRPDVMENPDTHRNLELDIYIPRLKIALEYDGAQHHKVVKKFHPNGESDLDAQRQRDALKDRLCREAGIYLIRVPYTVRVEQMEDYIRYYLPENAAARRTITQSTRG